MELVAGFVVFLFKLLATGILLAIGFEIGRRAVVWYDSQVALHNPKYQQYSSVG